MKKTLIALTAAAGFGLAELATAPAAAAPLAPTQLGLAIGETGVQIEQVRNRRHVRQHRQIRRHVRSARRHFWAPGPWAFRGLSHGNCFRVRGGYTCYY